MDAVIYNLFTGREYLALRRAVRCVATTIRTIKKAVHAIRCVSGFYLILTQKIAKYR